MKAIHKKQHQKNLKDDIVFECSIDKFGNLFLKASLDPNSAHAKGSSMSVSASHFPEHRIKHTKKILTKKLEDMVFS